MINPLEPVRYPVSLSLFSHDGGDFESLGLIELAPGYTVIQWLVTQLSPLFEEVLVITSSPKVKDKYLDLFDNADDPVEILLVDIDQRLKTGVDAPYKMTFALQKANCGWVMCYDICQPIRSLTHLECLLKHIFISKRVAQVSPIAYSDPFSGQALPLPSVWPKAIRTVLDLKMTKNPHSIQWLLENLNTVFYDGRSYLRENPYRFITEDDAKRFYAARLSNSF